jgi:hypothetical protein
MPPDNLPTCPECQRTDQVQKVTSVYSANTKEWKESYSTTDSWGNSETREETKQAHTVLGLKLKMPEEPAGPTHPGLWYGIGGVVVFILGIFACSFAFIPFSFVIPILTGSAFLPDIAGVPAWLASFVVIGLPTLCAIGGGVALLVWLGMKVKARFTRDLESYRAKRAVFERDEVPRWRRARERWEQLYYCMRDETVFLPGENRAVKADDLQKYLYNPHFGSG